MAPATPQLFEAGIAVIPQVRKQSISVRRVVLVLLISLFGLPDVASSTDIGVAPFRHYSPARKKDLETVLSLPGRGLFVARKGKDRLERVDSTSLGTIFMVQTSSATGMIAVQHRVRIGDSGKVMKVSVLDREGRMGKEFTETCHLFWDPPGSTLTVSFCHAQAEGPLIADSVLVWSAYTGKSRRLGSQFIQGAWLNPGTILFFSEGGVDSMNVVDGSTGTTTLHGLWPSPDRTYSIRASNEGGPYLMREPTGIDLTQSLRTTLGDSPLLSTEVPPFWNTGPDAKHELWVPFCLQTSGSPQTPMSDEQCWLFLVDVGTGAVLKRTKGQVVGRSSDAREVAIWRGGAMQVISVK